MVRRQIIITSDASLTKNFDLDDLREYCNKKSLSELIAEKFDVNDIMDPPKLDLDDPDDLVMYMAKGVDDFKIQYVGWEDPYQGKEFDEWRPENDEVPGWPEKLNPEAFKFTFTLYDSKGVMEKGRKFTHIVYLGN